MLFYPTFKLRDFSSAVNFPQVKMVPNSFSWMAIGGPDDASVTCYGNERSLWELIEWLRAPVIIHEQYGEPVWWGFVNTVEVRVGSVSVSVSLDGMFNRIAVAYGELNDTESGPGARATTSWAQNDDSAGMYGIKERIESLSNGTATSAAALRDSILDYLKYPIPAQRISQGVNSLSATMHLRGWWHTLDWQLYASSNTSLVATTTQIDTIISAEGQFITDVRLVDESTYTVNEYHDGDEPARKVVEELMAIGTTNGRRLLSTVSRDREAWIYEEPAYVVNEIDRFFRSDGTITTRSGHNWIGLTNPCAKWLVLKDIIPSTLDISKLSNPSYFFVERASFDPTTGLWTPEPRGTPDVWNVSPILGG